MDRLFRINFYPQDWLIDTAQLTPEQRGIFIQIVCLIYANRGPIKNDPSWISRVSNCSTRLATSLIGQLVALDFLQVQGDFITQKRAEHELNAKRTHLEDSANGGRTSAEKRAQSKENNNIASTDPAEAVPTTKAKAIAEAKEKNKNPLTPKGGIRGVEGVELPVWLDSPTWQDFVEFRKKIKAPLTDKAAKLAINELEKLRAQGHDPVAVVNQSILNNWKGLFAPKGDLNVRTSASPAAQGGQHHKPKASYVDKVKAAGAKALEHVHRQLDADRDMPWNGQDLVGAQQGAPALPDRDRQAVRAQRDGGAPQGDELEGSEL